jgi:dTDP-4-dehydrorhamnose reductase
VEIWGGLECSITRIEDRIEDQLANTGHYARPEDLNRFAALGLRTLRFPILWERHHQRPENWAETDARMDLLRQLGIRPIVGFVHHGAGPYAAGLADPEFVKGLARFARTVAERYPWVDAYTPINEPLTTARFSGLYGVWHPHGRSTHCFARLFLNECEGTRAAMKAVREINPRAQLIQTEDIGKTHSTPALAYQAALENERRWLTFDLLCGQLDPHGPMWKYLTRHGVTDAELRSFCDDPCAPDLLGVNYYVTSERFIDERLERYPPHSHGGNQRQAYADVTAVRVRAEGIVGHAGILREVWARYRRPIALTEVQLACTRDEQLRWLVEAWHSCQLVVNEGVDIRALTAWALLGSFDWDSLLVEKNGNYENGAFDVRSPVPRPTVLAGALRELSAGKAPEHPVLATAGWWRRDVRFEYPPVSAPATGKPSRIRISAGAANPSPLLIVGANGLLGRAFQKLCRLRGLTAVALSRQELDICDSDALTRTLENVRPWAVINASGYTRIDAADSDESTCFALNVRGPLMLAQTCAEHGITLATFSSDQVFDGRKGAPYTERDEPHPLNAYGRSKFEAEQRIARLHARTLIVRTSACFSPWDENNFIPDLLRRLRDGEHVSVPSDLVVSPTYVPDLVNATLDLLIDGESGVWHLANTGAVACADWAAHAARLAGLPVERILRVPAGMIPFEAKRPLFSALVSERGQLLGSWENALERFFSDRVAREIYASSSA